MGRGDTFIMVDGSEKRTLDAYQKYHSTKDAARLAVHSAVRHGLLPRVTDLRCDDCGKQAAHYHHESYLAMHWLNVVPLCTGCHGLRHAK